MAKPILRLVALPRITDIMTKLRLEEALLRHNKENWCLVSAVGGPSTVVVGRNGKPEQLLDVARVKRDGVPVVRRFTGGGTVIVGTGTVVATIISNKTDAPCGPFPRDIMAWTGEIYGTIFRRLGVDFRLRENDYVISDDLKIGGNAQTIIKSRWLHHTSFLVDFLDSDMAYLRIPDKRPDYRGDRPHSAFITRLRPRVNLAPTDFRSVLLDHLRSDLPSWFDIPPSDPLDDAFRILADCGPDWYGNSRLLLPGVDF